MKSVSSNKDLQFSLHIIDNYKKEILNSVNEIVNKYSTLIMEYYKFILENIELKNKKFARFIIIRGLDTITNVFLLLLLYTKNIDITYFHCQKSFYFYVEFVGQIAEDDKVFLQLSSRDASTYVYKKTIFEIHNDFKNTNESSNELTKEKMSIINSYVELYKIYINKMLHRDDFDKNTKYIVIFEYISKNLNDNFINMEKIKVLETIVFKLDNLITDVDQFFEINRYLVKRILKKNPNLDNCISKFSLDIFNDKLNEPVEKFIHWFIN